jgi:hypothetical protein
LAKNTLPVSHLDDAALTRNVLDELAVKMDGKAAAEESPRSGGALGIEGNKG